MNATNDKWQVEEFRNHCKTTTAAISPTIPIFIYDPANFKQHHQSVIRVGDVVIHTILDEGDFGGALGYKRKVDEKLTLDEFIWERYTRDGAQRTTHCLQVQLNAYLYKHSATYKQLYGDAYKKLIGNHNFVCTDDVSAICDSCAQLQALNR